MKKIKLLTLAFLSLPVLSSAQGFYFRAGLGYAFPQAGQTLDGTGTPYNGTANNTTNEISIKGASFSAGMQAQVGFGYMFNKNIGVQLDANLGFANRKYTFTQNNVMIDSVPSTLSVTQQASSIFILAPSIVLQTGQEPWNIYSRVGVALPLSSSITYDQAQSNQPGTGLQTTYDFIFEMKNSFSLGFTAAAGVQYQLNDRVSLWGECSMLSLSLYTKQMTLKDFTVNGQSQSLSYVSSPHVINYSKNAVIDNSGTIQPAYSQPFSNVGINVGIALKLGGRHTRAAMPGTDNEAGRSRSSRPKPSKFR
jgi:opacity protein-like surface antigen